MGFFGSLFGDDQSAALDAAHNNATAALSTGYDTQKQNYNTAIDKYNPYAQQGGQANTMYGNALGTNGLQAQQQFGQNYAANDPFRLQNAQLASDQLRRQYNSRGQGYSGSADLGVARANLQQGSQDYNNYLNRLQGAGQQGLTATGAQSGLYQGLGNAGMQYGQSQAGNEISYGNASAQNDTNSVNNILGFGSALLGGFTPGKSGTSAFGGIGNALSSPGGYSFRNMGG